MRRSCISLLAVTGAVIASACLAAQGQDLSEIQRLAAQISEKVAKEHPKRVLIGVRDGCVLSNQSCESLDSNLHEGLENSIPGIQFVSKEDVAQEVRKDGFLSIDVYDEFLLRGVASDLGAEIAIIENLVGEGRDYQLTGKIVKVSGDKEIGTFKASIPRSASDNNDEPVLIKDAESGVSLIVSRDRSNHSGARYYPACMKCPDPDYPEEARRKGLHGVMAFLVTISDQGVAEQISLIKTFDAGLTANAVQAIHGWRFKPAIGPDGKPFAARVPVEVTFRLLH
jgi:TonB family protein